MLLATVTILQGLGDENKRIEPHLWVSLPALPEPQYSGAVLRLSKRGPAALF